MYLSYIHTRIDCCHTHTHTHTYIYNYVCMYVCMYGMYVCDNSKKGKWGERYTFVSILAFSSAPHLVRHLPNAYASKRKPTVFFRGRTSLTFSKSQNPPRASGAWCHSHPPSPISHLGLLWHLWVTRPAPARARMNTCVNVCA